MNRGSQTEGSRFQAYTRATRRKGAAGFGKQPLSQIHGKKRGLSAVDSETLKRDERIINDEFSFLLKINSGDIGDCIKQKLQTAD